MLSAKTVSEKLAKWSAEHGRVFPWRKVKDPYRIMVVEFLLQRTRAETVEKVYDEVFRRFPDIEALAIAETKEIKDIFSRIGLLYRAVRLVELAKYILENYGGHIPSSTAELLKFDGVGIYIASAVLNFGHGIPMPVVDKNVMRVANRMWGKTRESDVRKLVEELYKYSDHKTVAYALIDLGSLVCKEKPRCDACPLNDMCPKFPLFKEKWRLLRKVRTAKGEVVLREQPIMKTKSNIKSAGRDTVSQECLPLHGWHQYVPGEDRREQRAGLERPSGEEWFGKEGGAWPIS
ncbi:MAG: hypothetical protein QXN86_02205 [Candidatus Methanomethylicaceae archaeon]